jgi:hypothetical protein
LRLPVDDLVQRDAMVLRMGSEVSVDAVIVEESGPERGEEGNGPRTRAIDPGGRMGRQPFHGRAVFLPAPDCRIWLAGEARAGRGNRA